MTAENIIDIAIATNINDSVVIHQEQFKEPCDSIIILYISIAICIGVVKEMKHIIASYIAS